MQLDTGFPFVPTVKYWKMAKKITEGQAREVSREDTHEQVSGSEGRAN